MQTAQAPFDRRDQVLLAGLIAGQVVKFIGKNAPLGLQPDLLPLNPHMA